MSCPTPEELQEQVDARRAEMEELAKVRLIEVSQLKKAILLAEKGQLDWRDMFERYVNTVGDQEGAYFLRHVDWSDEEKAAINALDLDGNSGLS